MKFLKFVQYHGDEPIWINPAHVAALRVAGADASRIVLSNGTEYGVIGGVNTVVHRLQNPSCEPSPGPTLI